MHGLLAQDRGTQAFQALIQVLCKGGQLAPGFCLGGAKPSDTTT